MTKKLHKYDSTKLQSFMAGLARRKPYETEFHQAVHEVAETVIPFIRKNPNMPKALFLSG